MPNENNQPQAIYTKNLPQGSDSGFAPPTQAAGVPQAGGSGSSSNKKQPKKIFGVDSKAVMAVLGLGLFFVVAMAGVLISQKQRLDETATAPSAPQSHPAANIEKPVTCSMTFVVPETEITPTPTDETTPTPTPTDETTPTPTPTGEVTITPTPTPDPNQCGYKGCENDADCNGDLVCVTAYDENNYCTMPEYAQTCIEDATSDDAMPYCCEPPVVATATPKPGATNTPAPGVTTSVTTTQAQTTTIITTVSCNDACTVNADCTNISHICYNGQCRLDSNPENTACQTPSGGTTVVVDQPVLPAELPETGFSDLANYFKIGLGALGAGLLLLLFI